MPYPKTLRWWFFSWLLAGPYLAMAVLHSAPAAAQTPKTLSGRWQASSMTVKWRIGEWGDACGPKPGGGGRGPASVLVTEVGKELRITGGGETFSTGNCVENYPGLQKRSHSAGGRGWSTVCKTGSDDPKQVTINTSINATDSEIVLQETGQYSYQVKGQNCTASSGKWRRYTLVQRAGELGPAPGERPTPAQPSPAPQPAATTQPALPAQPAPQPAPRPAVPPPAKPSGDTCNTLGPVGRLDVRPARKLMRAGETFVFRTTVWDVKGCNLQTRPTWRVVQPFAGAEVSPSGELKLSEDAGDGQFEIAVSISGKSTRVSVEVASKERYASLLSSGVYNEAGETEEVATVIIATASIGAEEAQAENKAARRKVWFVILAGVVALTLAVGGLFIYRRNRKRAKKELAEHEQEVERGLTEHDQAKLEAKRAHDDALKEHQGRVEKERAEYYAKKPKLICPLCGQKYPKGSKFCGKDGGQLVPIN